MVVMAMGHGHVLGVIGNVLSYYRFLFENFNLKRIRPLQSNTHEQSIIFAASAAGL